MGQACKRWVLASAVVCALGGLVLMATDPVQHCESPPRLAKKQPRRAVRHAPLQVASSTEPYDRGDGLPEPSSAAAPADGTWLDDQPPQPAVVHDRASFGDEPLRPMFPLALASPPAASREPTAERPARMP